MNMKEYIDELKSQGVNPYKRYTVAVTVSEAELNALEDLVHAELPVETEQVCRKLAGRLWQKLVDAVDSGRVCVELSRREAALIQFALVSTDELWKQEGKFYVPKDDVAALLEKIGRAIDKEADTFNGHPRFYELLEEVKRIYVAKNMDYSPEEPLGNFRESAKWVGVEAWRGVLVRMADKWARLTNLCKRSGRHSVSDETVVDTALDLAVYAILFVILWEEESGHREASRPHSPHVARLRRQDAYSNVYRRRDGWSGPGQAKEEGKND